MSHLRQNPLTGTWVIIDQSREYVLNPLPNQLDTASYSHTYNETRCPFCEGHEGLTPHEIFATRQEGAPDTPGWTIRVIPNRLPVLRVEGEWIDTHDGLYHSFGGLGAHELIIETPDHDAKLKDYSLDHLCLLSRAWRDRMVDLHKDFRLYYLQIFRNCGIFSGEQLTHPHSQLIAMPNLPSEIAIELTRVASFFQKTKSCLSCSILDRENAERHRIVHENDSFIALAPYASRVPFELWILPKRHMHSFTEIADSELASFSYILKESAYVLNQALPGISLTLAIKTSPNLSNQSIQPMPTSQEISESFHWRLELIPQVTSIGGFNLATGSFINPTPPESATDCLRKYLRSYL